MIINPAGAHTLNRWQHLDDGKAAENLHNFPRLHSALFIRNFPENGSAAQRQHSAIYRHQRKQTIKKILYEKKYHRPFT